MVHDKNQIKGVAFLLKWESYFQGFYSPKGNPDLSHQLQVW